MPEPTSPPAGRTILVTGASSGIGRCAAETLHARGWRVFAAVRKAEDRESLEKAGIATVRLDYADALSIRYALERVLARTGGRLDALFNNGGYAQLGAVEDVTTEALRAQFEANFFGWHELTRRVVPVMRAQKSGRIVNCSSVLGYVSGKYRGAYAASKYALEGLTDALRMELAGSGVHVVLIEPGPIRTKFVPKAVGVFDRSVDAAASPHAEAYVAQRDGLVGPGAESRLAKPPEVVVETLVAALESGNPRPRYRVTLPARAVWTMRRLLSTRMMDRIVSRF